MTTTSTESTNRSIDRALVARVVGEVVARLNASALVQPNLPVRYISRLGASPGFCDRTVASAKTAIPKAVLDRSTRGNLKAQTAADSIDDRVITVDTIDRVRSTSKQLLVPRGAVVTPAARDQASSRGITIRFAVEAVPPQRSQAVTDDAVTAPPLANITDPREPERAITIGQQLIRRGITRLDTTVVLSDTPASDVHRYCQVDRERAVMIASLIDVDRFWDEFKPTVWVLDMARANFVAAVNIVARIARTTD